jgi:hypothetical protein
VVVWRLADALEGLRRVHDSIEDTPTSSQRLLEDAISEYFYIKYFGISIRR